MSLLTRWNNFAMAAQLMFADPAVVDAWIEFHESPTPAEMDRMAKAQREQDERMAEL